METSPITQEERLNLNKLMRDMETIDNTEYIRKVKQSGKIAKDVYVIEQIKQETMQWRFDEPERFIELCQSSCKFLFNNYTDIFNKLVKDELNLEIMKQFLWHLSMIETGQIDQHEGSVLIGRLLKELFLDSAIRRGNKLDEENKHEEPVKEAAISWTEYKQHYAANSHSTSVTRATTDE